MQNPRVERGFSPLVLPEVSSKANRPFSRTAWAGQVVAAVEREAPFSDAVTHAL